jgi:cystathionine beta-lyase/cystathionine gamma-synthase
MKFATRAIHIGQEADPLTGATIIPVYPSSTYTQEEIGKHKGYEYSRTGNPTRRTLESCLASLEEGEYGLAFASGMAAIVAVLSILRPGDHVVATEDIYGGTYRLFERVYRQQGITTTYADGRMPETLAKAISPATKLIWIESPTNPLLQLVDIQAVAAFCRNREVRLIVDNTFATPYLQRPLTLGAHAVVHSTTKYINGHSDVVGGAVVTSDRELFREMRFYQNAAGAVPSPFDCWLTLRGLKTLALRMRVHEENAMAVAEHLNAHPFAEAVRYPGLPGHPQHELAKRQMDGFGGMVSFQLRGGREAANVFFKCLKLFSFAESLGGVESLACYPPTMTHGSIPEEERKQRGITDSTIRLSVGIEDKDDLIADLDQALQKASSV